MGAGLSISLYIVGNIIVLTSFISLDKVIRNKREANDDLSDSECQKIIDSLNLKRFKYKE